MKVKGLHVGCEDVSVQHWWHWWLAKFSLDQSRGPFMQGGLQNKQC